jgi:hypothetical protein
MRINNLSFLICLLLVFTKGYGQNNTLGFGLGGAAFKGETSDDVVSIVEEIGVQSHLYYARALRDNRWQFMVQLNYNRILAEIDVNSVNGQLITFSTASQHYFGALGLRFYFDSKSRRYLPSAGHSAPFLGTHLGFTSFFNETNSPVFNDGDNIQVQDGNYMDLAFQAELGYRYYLNEDWSLEANANFRHGTNDLWDGLGGKTEFNDWIISLAFGFAVNLN